VVVVVGADRSRQLSYWSRKFREDTVSGKSESSLESESYFRELGADLKFADDQIEITFSEDMKARHS
jgi:hypothetical protein